MGKNQFNSSFPASLVAYMSSKGIEPIYLCIDSNNNFKHSSINATTLLGIDPLSDDAYYNFEAGFYNYERFYIGDREKIDLVMINNHTKESLRGLEVKLTALPDNTTRNKDEEHQGCEIVMRPPTICFLACSMCEAYAQNINRLAGLIKGVPKINHWESIEEVAPHYAEIEAAIRRVAKDMYKKQNL